MYTVYVYPDVVLKFHKDISTSYEDIDQIFAWSFLKFVINLINDHLLWNRGKILTPTIAFTLTTEYVQVMEGNKNMFQITFFSTLSVTTYVQVSLLLLIYIYIYIYIVFLYLKNRFNKFKGHPDLVLSGTVGQNHLVVKGLKW